MIGQKKIDFLLMAKFWTCFVFLTASITREVLEITLVTEQKFETGWKLFKFYIIIKNSSLQKLTCKELYEIETCEKMNLYENIADGIAVIVIEIVEIFVKIEK